MGTRVPLGAFRQFNASGIYESRHAKGTQWWRTTTTSTTCDAAVSTARWVAVRRGSISSLLEKPADPPTTPYGRISRR